MRPTSRAQSHGLRGACRQPGGGARRRARAAHDAPPMSSTVHAARLAARQPSSVPPSIGCASSWPRSTLRPPGSSTGRARPSPRRPSLVTGSSTPGSPLAKRCGTDHSVTMSPAHEGQLLGELIVERGLMSDEQLEDALLEQRVSRKRTRRDPGRERRASRPRISQPRSWLSSATGPDAIPDPARIAPELIERRRGRRRTTAQRTLPAAAADRGQSCRERRRALRPGHEERPATARRRRRSTFFETFEAITQSHLAELRREFEEAGEELEAARIELLARSERIAELETLLESSDRERRQLAEALRDEMARTESKLRRVSDAPSPRPGRRRQQRPKRGRSGPREPRPRAGYLLLVPDALGGHALRECAGDPPAVGSQIELGGHRFLVVSHRRSPIGSDDRLCVQLQIG